MLPQPEFVMFSIWLPRNTGYLLEEQDAWILIKPPSEFRPGFENVAQWVGDGRILKSLYKKESVI